MYRAKKTDQNHVRCMEALRKCGASVADTSAMGRGFPDLVVGWRGITLLIEVKNPNRNWKLEDTQRKFFKNWNGGPIVVMENPEDAPKLLTIIKENGND